MAVSRDTVELREGGAGGRGNWFALDVADVAARLETDPESGLSKTEAAERLARYGPNEIRGEAPPSVWAVAVGQVRDPMNIMLVAVTAVSLAIGETSTGILIALLVLLNVFLGS